MVAHLSPNCTVPAQIYLFEAVVCSGLSVLLPRLPVQAVVGVIQATTLWVVGLLAHEWVPEWVCGWIGM